MVDLKHFIKIKIILIYYEKNLKLFCKIIILYKIYLFNTKMFKYKYESLLFLKYLPRQNIDNFAPNKKNLLSNSTIKTFEALNDKTN